MLQRLSLKVAFELKTSSALSTYKGHIGLSVSGSIPANLTTIFLNLLCEDSSACSFSFNDSPVIAQIRLTSIQIMWNFGVMVMSCNSRKDSKESLNLSMIASKSGSNRRPKQAFLTRLKFLKNSMNGAMSNLPSAIFSKISYLSISFEHWLP